MIHPELVLIYLSAIIIGLQQRNPAGRSKTSTIIGTDVTRYERSRDRRRVIWIGITEQTKTGLGKKANTPGAFEEIMNCSSNLEPGTSLEKILPTVQVYFQAIYERILYKRLLVRLFWTKHFTVAEGSNTRASSDLEQC